MLRNIYRKYDNFIYDYWLTDIGHAMFGGINMEFEITHEGKKIGSVDCTKEGISLKWDKNAKEMCKGEDCC